MELNTTILREISFQLTLGNPWWGMLLANEYIDRSSPLRPALVLKFKQKLGSALTARESLAQALICGRKKSGLSHGELATIGSRVVSRFKPSGFLRPTPPRTDSNRHTTRSTKRITERLAIRQRSNHIARFNSSSAVRFSERTRRSSIGTTP
jgi:hypothetical protein